MNNASAANTGAKNATGSIITVLSKAEGIALCSAFVLASVLIVVGNLLTIIVFALNKTLRKRSLFLVINMTFADLMLGALSLPGYIFIIGNAFQLWTGVNITKFATFNRIVDTVFSQASLISAVFLSGERFFAIYRPLEHRTLSTRAYRVVIFTVWTLAILISTVFNVLFNFISLKHAMYAWAPYTLTVIFIICGCNIAIWRKFQHGSVSSQQHNRALQNKRLTKTLLFVSVLALLSWLPLNIMSFLIYVFRVQISSRFYLMVNVVNYSNSFVNPVVYALRISEFKQALALCCLRREAAMDDDALTQLRTLRADPSHLQLAAFEQVVMDTKL